MLNMSWAWNISPRPVTPPDKWHLVNATKMPGIYIRALHPFDFTLHISAIRKFIPVRESIKFFFE